MKKPTRLADLRAAALVAAVTLVSAAPALAQEQSTIPSGPTDKAAMERIIHDYLMAHPEVILESVQRYQDEQEKLAAAQQSQSITTLQERLTQAAGSPVLGNPLGNVTVVEFFDYRCPYCKSGAAAFINGLEADGNVRIVLKEFPILGPESEFAARAALAAQKQGKYRDLHLALMAFKGKLKDDDVRRLARDAGIDVARMEIDMKAADVETELQQNRALADTIGIKGTPAFVIGEELIPGAVALEEIQKRISALRQG